MLVGQSKLFFIFKQEKESDLYYIHQRSLYVDTPYPYFPPTVRAKDTPSQIVEWF